MKADATRKFTALAAGVKGATFIQSIIRAGLLPSRIASYQVVGEPPAAIEQIKAICKERGIKFEESKSPAYETDELIVVIGWQYLIKDKRPRLIIFHDSLLPRYRGFAPTVTALIKGDQTIGVTALFAADSVDAGEIIAQSEIPIDYPIKIASALELQASAMAELAFRILGSDSQIKSTPQDEQLATYSIWRDTDDFRIDWSQNAESIGRTIDAIGPPYAGARAAFCGKTVTIFDATVVADLSFEIRQPGKIWRFEEGRPIVVCGSGLLRLDRVVDASGERVQFDKLRARLT